jgi:transketolase
VTLTDWQKRDALKRVREQYQEELTKIEGELIEFLTRAQEADLIAAYLGEQPEVKALRPDPKEVETRQRRRDHLGQILERLDAVVKELPAVQAPPPGGGKPGIRRY